MTIMQWLRSLRCPHFADPKDPRETLMQHIRTVSIFEHRYVYDITDGSEANSITTITRTVEKHYQCARCGMLRIDYLMPDVMPPVMLDVLSQAADVARGGRA